MPEIVTCANAKRLDCALIPSGSVLCSKQSGIRTYVSGENKNQSLILASYLGQNIGLGEV